MDNKSETRGLDFWNYLYNSFIDFENNDTSTDLLWYEKEMGNLNHDFEIASAISGWSILGMVLMLVFALLRHLAKRDRVTLIPDPIFSVGKGSNYDSGFFEDTTQVPISSEISSNKPTSDCKQIELPSTGLSCILKTSK